MGAWWRGNGRLVVQNCGEAFGSRGAHLLFKWASQIGSEMVKLEEFVMCTVKAP
jgi:hypothetical protein